MQQHGWFFFYAPQHFAMQFKTQWALQSKTCNISCTWKWYLLNGASPSWCIRILTSCQSILLTHCTQCCSPVHIVPEGLKYTFSISSCLLCQETRKKKSKCINPFTEQAASNTDWAQAPLPPTSYAVPYVSLTLILHSEILMQNLSFSFHSDLSLLINVLILFYIYMKKKTIITRDSFLMLSLWK